MSRVLLGLVLFNSATAAALALPTVVGGRCAPPAMLLGADGLPMKKDGAAAAPPPQGAPAQGVRSSASPLLDQLPSRGEGGEDTSGGLEAMAARGEVPEDLKDFDPSFDPLAAKRPKYDLAAASGRPNEAVWGAIAAESAAELSEWASHVKQTSGATRMLGLFTAEEAAARSAAGTAEGYFAELCAAGPFEQDRVGLVDPRAPGARRKPTRMARRRTRACVVLACMPERTTRRVALPSKQHGKGLCCRGRDNLRRRFSSSATPAAPSDSGGVIRASASAQARATRCST